MSVTLSIVARPVRKFCRAWRTKGLIQPEKRESAGKTTEEKLY